jgi:hypothetical protein
MILYDMIWYYIILYYIILYYSISCVSDRKAIDICKALKNMGWNEKGSKTKDITFISITGSLIKNHVVNNIL